jgi:hypothetical protein
METRVFNYKVESLILKKNPKATLLARVTDGDKIYDVELHEDSYSYTFQGKKYSEQSYYMCAPAYHHPLRDGHLPHMLEAVHGKLIELSERCANDAKELGTRSGEAVKLEGLVLHKGGVKGRFVHRNARVFESKLKFWRGVVEEIPKKFWKTIPIGKVIQITPAEKEPGEEGDRVRVETSTGLCVHMEWPTFEVASKKFSYDDIGGNLKMLPIDLLELLGEMEIFLEERLLEISKEDHDVLYTDDVVFDSTHFTMSQTIEKGVPVYFKMAILQKVVSHLEWVRRLKRHPFTNYD